MISGTDQSCGTIEGTEIPLPTAPAAMPWGPQREPRERVVAYRGTFIPEHGCFVAVGVLDAGVFRVAGELDQRLDLARHSPGGFAWGGSRPGAAQLALALLAHHFGPSGSERAIEFYQIFKAEVIATLPHEGWILTAPQIDVALEGLQLQTTPRGGGLDQSWD